MDIPQLKEKLSDINRMGYVVMKLSELSPISELGLAM